MDAWEKEQRRQEKIFRKALGLGTGIRKKKKRVRLTSRQKIYIWEHPRTYGRTCNICHKRITKLSDLELDHTKPYSKGGKRLRLAHRECNRMKGSGSLRKIQKALGIKPTKKKRKKKKTTKRKRKRKSSYGITIPEIRIPTIRIWGD